MIKNVSTAIGIGTLNREMNLIHPTSLKAVEVMLPTLILGKSEL